MTRTRIRRSSNSPRWSAATRFRWSARGPDPEFRLAELAHMRFASTSEVPTPWLCLEQDIRDAGIDPARLPRITGNTHGGKRRRAA